MTGAARVESCSETPTLARFQAFGSLIRRGPLVYGGVDGLSAAEREAVSEEIPNVIEAIHQLGLPVVSQEFVVAIPERFGEPFTVEHNMGAMPVLVMSVSGDLGLRLSYPEGMPWDESRITLVYYGAPPRRVNNRPARLIVTIVGVRLDS